ncbi:MAG: hypothetical protein P4N60_07595 [Verrucomicrobiae bacterium]|nr:hypothetical protein [Verrucomicrobiae bacterium]
MKIRVAQLILFLAVASLAAFVSGCASTESDNASVRPWNTPQGWEGGALNGMDGMQHR